MTTDWKMQHFPSAVGCFVHRLAQELIEDRNPNNFVHSGCVWLVTDSVAFPERLLLRGYAASHHSELSLVPCDVAVSGVGWAANRCTAYHANVEAGNLCPRALGVNNYSCKKCYMNANIFTEQEVCSENRLTNFHIINLNFYPQKSVELNQYWILFGI